MISLFLCISACSTSITRVAMNPGFKSPVMPVKDKPYTQYIVNASKHSFEIFHLREDTIVEDVLKDVNQYALQNNIKVIPDPSSIRYSWFLFWGHVSATFITSTEY